MVTFLVVLSLGVKGILLASLLAACVAFLVTLREYVHDLTTNVTRSVGREMLSFAWPGVIGGVAFYAINFADRFFVRHYHGLADAGVYDVAYRYAQIVLLAVIAFRMGWPQWHYSWLHSDRHPQMVSRGVNYYFVVVGFLAVGVSAWILPAAPPARSSRSGGRRARAVAPLGLAAIATGAYSLFAVGFMVTKRMRTLPVLVVGGGLHGVGAELPAHPAVLVRRRRLGDRDRVLRARAGRRVPRRADLPGALGLAADRRRLRAGVRARGRLARRGRLDADGRVAPGAGRDRRRLRAGRSSRSGSFRGRICGRLVAAWRSRDHKVAPAELRLEVDAVPARGRPLHAAR